MISFANRIHLCLQLGGDLERWVLSGATTVLMLSPGVRL